MDYNSNRKKLVLPEYGRHIQKMVDYACTIEDKEERTRVAKAIIGVMGNLFPHLRDINDFKHKLWDHLAIMADFKLDIDYPFDPPKREKFQEHPRRIPYNQGNITYKHYGRIVERMIHEATKMEDGPLKRHLIMLLGNHMKKSLSNWNKDNATDERILSDIKKLSRGKLQIDEQARIADYREHQSSNNNHGRNRKKHIRKNN
ncbi:DUF4290 domain-containing protein [Thermophagus xiamenensis]|jgi:hypothetical protein|uniref:DUF4290 domain-containing protein n=1 Tax=Thermophagus xiamenensis TaxID=385682 RepID=A0A1I1UBM5_9BACT|nr:DUF4290 domain-containing protein [Thermophagus xiamenensis]SFD68084.1 protein of unknown function [Thermophagus xiamenensis]